MHGLNIIKRLNQTEQDFVDHILATPYQDTNLLDVWHQWKQEQARELAEREIALTAKSIAR
jgi:hypothetical protein